MLKMTDDQKRRTAALLAPMGKGFPSQYFFRLMREIGVENTLKVCRALYLPEEESDVDPVVKAWKAAVLEIKRQTVELPSDLDGDGKEEGPWEDRSGFEFPFEEWEKS